MPDLVFDEHRQTCWAKSDTKRVIFVVDEFELFVDLIHLPTEGGNSNGKQEKEVWSRCGQILHCA